jgi:hypothetical protein
MCFAMGIFPVSSAHCLLVITEHKTIVGKARGPDDMSHEKNERCKTIVGKARAMQWNKE